LPWSGVPTRWIRRAWLVHQNEPPMPPVYRIFYYVLSVPAIELILQQWIDP
jgi:hypothetical protein